jgi:hypothetical protein
LLGTGAGEEPRKIEAGISLLMRVGVSPDGSANVPQVPEVHPNATPVNASRVAGPHGSPHAVNSNRSLHRTPTEHLHYSEGATGKKRLSAVICGDLAGSLPRSLRFEGCSVYKNRTLDGHGIQERLQYEASILGVSDNSGQSPRRLVGFEFQSSLDSRPTSSNRLSQDRSFLTNVRGYMHPRLSIFTLIMCPYRATWVSSQNAMEAQK